MANHTKTTRWRQRYVDYPLQAAIAYVAFTVFRLLPLDRASSLGGWAGRTFGPGLSGHQRAEANLKKILPDCSESERKEILRGMWDNLGRTAAEYPHLPELAHKNRIEVIGAEHYDALIADGKPAILFSGHLANWEVHGVAAWAHGAPLTLVYRQPNNPWIDALIQRFRGRTVDGLIRKGAEGARGIAKAIRQRRYIGMLVDQKMNDGISVPFFGRPAMTAPAIAQFALKFDCALLPARIERLEGARFRLTVHPPLELPKGDRSAEAINDVMTRINLILEDWIRARPEQWLWMHRRWRE